MWINEQNKNVFILHSDIRYELWKANIEAPGVLTDEYLTTVGYQPVVKISAHADLMTETAVAQPPIKNDSGQWEVHEIGIPLDPAIVANRCFNVIKIRPDVAEILKKAGYYDSVATHVEERRKEALWRAANAFEASAITATVSSLVTQGVLQNKLKCTAVRAWVNAIWVEYYIRKDSGSDNLNFLTIGACPYTASELLAELA